MMMSWRSVIPRRSSTNAGHDHREQHPSTLWDDVELSKGTSWWTLGPWAGQQKERRRMTQDGWIQIAARILAAGNLCGWNPIGRPALPGRTRAQKIAKHEEEERPAKKPERWHEAVCEARELLQIIEVDEQGDPTIEAYPAHMFGELLTSPPWTSGTVNPDARIQAKRNLNVSKDVNWYQPIFNIFQWIFLLIIKSKAKKKSEG